MRQVIRWALVAAFSLSACACLLAGNWLAAWFAFTTVFFASLWALFCNYVDELNDI